MPKYLEGYLHLSVLVIFFLSAAKFSKNDYSTIVKAIFLLIDTSVTFNVLLFKKKTRGTLFPSKIFSL